MAGLFSKSSNTMLLLTEALPRRLSLLHLERSPWGSTHQSKNRCPTKGTLRTRSGGGFSPIDRRLSGHGGNVTHSPRHCGDTPPHLRSLRCQQVALHVWLSPGPASETSRESPLATTKLKHGIPPHPVMASSTGRGIPTRACDIFIFRRETAPESRTDR